MIIDVVAGDVRTTPLDALVLKYADGHYGADAVVALAMSSPLVVPAGSYKLFKAEPQIAAKELLVLGVGPLHDFDYPKIKKFAERALLTLRQERPEARTVGITLHGPGYGLDELACIGSLVDGLVSALTKDMSVDGIGSGEFRVLIIETSSKRAARIREFLNSLSRTQSSYPLESGEHFSSATANAISSEGTYDRRLFASMPFNRDFLDHWELALQPAAHENSLVIERLDHESFTGDIVIEIRKRIERALAVVGILDLNNPNVFLEVGYAWGVGKPTILALKKGDVAPFDVQGQKLIRYERLGQLKSALATELRALFPTSHS